MKKILESIGIFYAESKYTSWKTLSTLVLIFIMFLLWLSMPPHEPSIIGALLSELW